MREKLTKRSMKPERARGTRAVVWDELQPGFGVRYARDGRRTFVARYRVPGLGRKSHQRWVTLGNERELTLDQARKLAKRTLADATSGLDPAAQRRARREAPTVRELGATYLGDVAAHRRPYTAYEYRRLWNKHVAPSLGSKKVAEVTVTEVRKLHRSLQKTPVVANRVRRLVRAFFSFAEREGERPRYSNPAREIQEYREMSRERFLSHDERMRFGEALARAERDGLPPAPELRKKPHGEQAARHRPKSADVCTPANPYAVAALRVLYFTGCREQEILSLKWSEVDLGSGFLRLVETKTGKSVRPLNAPAREVLATLHPQAGSPYVFPSPRKSAVPLKEIKRLWYAVRHAAQLDGVRLHDFRHTTASVMAAGGASLLEIGAVLGHKSVNTTKRYAHLVEDRVKAWSERTGQELRAGLDGVSQPPQPLRREPASESA